MTNAEGSKLQPLTPRASTGEQVARALRDALLSGLYSPGERLRESRIAAELGVSKTPVREALAALRHSGLVEGSNSRTLVVATVTDETVQNLYELRMLVEPASVLKSVPKMNEEVIAKARRLLETSARRGREHDLPHLSNANRRFHELMCSRCGNPYVLGVLADMRDRLQFVAARGWIAQWSWDVESEEHRAILEAAERGDGNAAAELTRTHIENSLARLKKVDLARTDPAALSDDGAGVATQSA